jgi:branched-chain amino acid transport system ATP-binding protein
VLSVESIDVLYGDLQVLWNVSFQVSAGEIVVLLGSNGSGKSTTLKTISSILKPARGAITFQGARLDRLKAHKIVEYGLAHVPEGRRLFPEMTVEENLIVGSLISRSKRKRAQTMGRIYNLFPRLEERRRQLAGTLSGGEQQMLAIGRGMMSLPRLLMLDEPSLGLAPILVSEIFRIVEMVKDEGVTVLLVEQNVKHTLAMCDRAYVLENGRIALAGSGAEFLNNDHIKEAYLGM